MVFGKIIAGLLGLLFAGPFGLLLGLLVGHWFDRGLQHSLGFGSPEHLAQAQQVFFETSFLLLGQLAKADGRVSEAEIAHTEAIIRRLGATEAHRREAIALFKRGSQPDFEMEPALSRFNELCGGHRQARQALLTFLISLAAADGHLHPTEVALLERVAICLDYTAAEFQRLMRMLEAQSHFHGAADGAVSSRDQLADAYQALGIDPDCSDRELKLAWRRRMSENHPDKLIARGVPEQMIKLATERSQEIQTAYELVRRQRKAA